MKDQILAGMGLGIKLRFHPTGNREPEQGEESWKLNGGVRWAAGWPGGPKQRQRQQERAVSIVPRGETQSSKRHRAARPPNAQCCLLSTRPHFLDQENIMIYIYLENSSTFWKKILPFG